MFSFVYYGNLSMLKQVLAVGSFSSGSWQSSFEIVNFGSILENPSSGDRGHDVTNINNFECSASVIFSTIFQNHFMTELLLLKPPI